MSAALSNPPPSYVLELGPDGAEARFSPCRVFRYLLRRVITVGPERTRCVFVMLNPSDADAFKPDPTVSRCVEFTRRWGYDVLEVVNLYAYRTPKPQVLRAHVRECLIRFPDVDVALEAIGCGRVNTAHILGRCADADRVIAAWGNNGEEDGLLVDGRTRSEIVRSMLEGEGIDLYHLGTSSSGAPLHPLARGKSWIPYTREPVRWA